MSMATQFEAIDLLLTDSDSADYRLGVWHSKAKQRRGGEQRTHKAKGATTH
jgi:hypothetical protein